MRRIRVSVSKSSFHLKKPPPTGRLLLFGLGAGISPWLVTEAISDVRRSFPTLTRQPPRHQPPKGHPMACRYGDILTQVEVPQGLSSRLAKAFLAEQGIRVGKSTINDHNAGNCVCADRLGAKVQAGGARILIIDIERLAGKAWAFDPKTRYIPAGNWIEWPRTVCYAARWYGQKDPIFEAEWIDREQMVRKAWELYDEADIVVTFNGKRFDDKHLKTEWLEAGLGAPRPWKAVDLFQIVKQFGYESKSLDSVTKRLGAQGKQLRYDVWQTAAAVEGDTEAQQQLMTYNIGDIELTEWLYDRLRGWIPNHPFMGTHGEDKICNQCGSSDLKLQPTRYRAVVIDYALYRCNHCQANVRGGWQGKAAGTRGIAA